MNSSGLHLSTVYAAHKLRLNVFILVVVAAALLTTALTQSAQVLLNHYSGI